MGDDGDGGATGYLSIWRFWSYDTKNGNAFSPSQTKIAVTCKLSMVASSGSTDWFDDSYGRIVRIREI